MLLSFPLLGALCSPHHNPAPLSLVLCYPLSAFAKLFCSGYIILMHLYFVVYIPDSWWISAFFPQSALSKTVLWPAKFSWFLCMHEVLLNLYSSPMQVCHKPLYCWYLEGEHNTWGGLVPVSVLQFCPNAMWHRNCTLLDQWSAFAAPKSWRSKHTSHFGFYRSPGLQGEKWSTYFFYWAIGSICHCGSPISREKRDESTMVLKCLPQLSMREASWNDVIVMSYPVNYSFHTTNKTPFPNLRIPY